MNGISAIQKTKKWRAMNSFLLHWYVLTEVILTILISFYQNRSCWTYNSYLAWSHCPDIFLLNSLLLYCYFLTELTSTVLIIPTWLGLTVRIFSYWTRSYCALTVLVFSYWTHTVVWRYKPWPSVGKVELHVIKESGGSERTCPSVRCNLSDAKSTYRVELRKTGRRNKTKNGCMDEGSMGSKKTGH
jgi:hypothetical protein